MRRWLPALMAITALALLHLAVGALAGPGLSKSLNVALFATNLYVLYCARLLTRESASSLGLFVVGYFILFVLLIVVMDRKPLFILMMILYASVFRSRFLLGCFVVLVLSFIVLQPYPVESLVVLGSIYLALWRTRSAPLFVRVCLGGGLLALGLVLFPLLHLVIQDSAQTLLNTAQRPDVQEALWNSVSSSTIATAWIAAFGIPLAYALARVDFAGKRLVLTLIDIPILVPQSVAGIALVVLLGPGSPLGQVLQSTLGFGISGTMLGLVVAQVFVAAPFLVKTALTAFESVPVRLELASRSLGATARQTFFRVALPLASRGVMVGLVLAWARAISEFGAVVLFASSPTTAPVLVHTEFLRAGAAESRPVATLLLITCLWIFVLLSFGQTVLPLGLRQAAHKDAP